MKVLVIISAILFPMLGFSQNGNAIFLQTSPTDATIRDGENVIGSTPLLLSKEELRKVKELTLSKAGFEDYSTKNLNTSTIAVRLKPKSGYNRETIKSMFFAVYKQDTVYIDPMALEYECRSLNTFDLTIKYRILGAINDNLASKFEGENLTYLSSYSSGSAVMSYFELENAMPFPVQQKLIDVSLIEKPEKKGKKKDTGIKKAQKQLWYILAQEKGKFLYLFFLDERLDPKNKDGYDFAGRYTEKPKDLVLVYENENKLELVNATNLETIFSEFSNNSALQSALGISEYFEEFSQILANDPTLISSIMDENWENTFGEAKDNPEKANSAIQLLLEARKKTETNTTIGGQQDFFLDSTEYGLTDVQKTPWFLNGIERTTKKDTLTDKVFYDPENGYKNFDASKTDWYLRNVDSVKASQISTNPKFINPHQKSKYPKKPTKNWYKEN